MPSCQSCPEEQYAVDADAQNLGMDPIEPVEHCLVRWDLVCSYWCPGQREESQDDIAAPAKIAQLDGLSGMAFQSKIWSRDSYR
jgi:hypothetical protein